MTTTNLYHEFQGNGIGNLLVHLESFHRTNDEVIQLRNVSSFRDDPSPFRDFQKRVWRVNENNTMETILASQTISAEEYYDLMFFVNPDKVFQLFAYSEHYNGALFIIAVDHESERGFLKIEGDFAKLPKRFQKYFEMAVITEYKTLGEAFFLSSDYV